MPQNPIDDKSTLAQVMDWCGQATSHYLSQCWPRSMWPYGVTRPGRNRRKFSDDIFKCIFLNKNVLILIKILLKFILYGPINNIPPLVQIMAWCRPGNIIWTNDNYFTEAYVSLCLNELMYSLLLYLTVINYNSTWLHFTSLQIHTLRAWLGPTNSCYFFPLGLQLLDMRAVKFLLLSEFLSPHYDQNE